MTARTTDGWLYEYVGKHRSTEFPDSGPGAGRFTRYVGQHRKGLS